ncbi:type II secretion system F family protein [bacterium]|nr:type II secretion system F family protein [bacterium]
MKKDKKNILNINIEIGGTGLTQKALFAKNLSVMLKSGLTISESLVIALDSAKGKFRKIIKGILKSVESGHSLSEAFSFYPKVFSGLFVNITNSGEASGNLDESMENISAQLEKEKELISKVKGALVYPVIILIASIILGGAMVFFVLPKITPLFEGLNVELPTSTRFLIWFSNFVQNYYLTLFFGLIFFFIFMFWFFRQKFIKPITHWLLLRIPVVSHVSRGTNLSRFCRSLATLLKSGLNIDEAFDITRGTLNNFYYKRAVVKAGDGISRGGKISENLAYYKHLFPNIVIKMIKVGEESGRLEETLNYLANYYEAEVDNSTKSLSVVIEPVLLLGIGLVVGFLAISIITPIYSITGGIKN